MSELCGAMNKQGKPCAAPAGRGTDHPGIGKCKHHGGCTPNHVKAANKIMARNAAEEFGVEVVTTPEEALVKALHTAAGMVVFYLAKITEAGDEGHTEMSVAGKAPSVWVKLHAEALDRMSKLAEVCVKLGLEERKVAVDEQAASLVVRVIEMVLVENGVKLDDTVKGSVTQKLLELGS